MIESYQEEQIL